MPKFNVGETVYNKHTHEFGEIVKYQWQKTGYIYLISHPLEDAWYLERQLTNEVKPVDNENKMKNVLAELLEHIKTTSKEDLEKEFEELKEWSNVGPTVEEFMDFCNKVNKKLEYPKTYDECCKNVLGLVHWGMTVDVPMHYSPLIINFTKLLICRDAYWKLAGNWKPNWNEANDCIINWNGEIKCEPIVCKNVILAFPTEEMRDAFYKNFKDLIEKCKELL
jgi:DNA-directed RNA polymerase subunit L